ncbi:sensor histidine kinase [Curtobacterium flaccumfaciens]|uniref:sensor histidine kinase n=1 Tax=Curtobacterium flaccumfaciens TaxID=2035 RepID=UPI00265A680D|nr:ATP-binding protein [Curtobacterium flaccumfaciens]MCS5520554.1 histidine kinase [Curtobacterium flaccumfaciens]
MPPVPPSSSWHGLGQFLSRRASALAAAAVALVTAVGTLRYHQFHAGEPNHVVAVALGVALIAAGSASAVVLLGRPVPVAVPLGLALLAVVLVVVAPSAAWSVVPLVVLLQTTARVVPATLASAAAIVVAAVSVPRLTGNDDPGLLVGCLLSGSVFLAAIVVSRVALHERSRTVRQLVATSARLVASERRAGALEARQHVAAELHDTVVQSVAGALFLTEAAERSGDDALAQQARRALRSAVVDTRALVDGLGADHPDVGESANGAADGPTDSLTAALSTAAERVGARWSVVGEPQTVTPIRAMALLRSAQGALGNAERHAGAASISLEFRNQDDSVAVVVRDDGRGFDPSLPVTPGPTGGHGLTMMRRRLEAVGGTLDIRSGPDGTVLRATVPLEEP